MSTKTLQENLAACNHAHQAAVDASAALADLKDLLSSISDISLRSQTLASSPQWLNEMSMLLSIIASLSSPQAEINSSDTSKS